MLFRILGIGFPFLAIYLGLILLKDAWYALLMFDLACLALLYLYPKSQIFHREASRKDSGRAKSKGPLQLLRSRNESDVFQQKFFNDGKLPEDFFSETEDDDEGVSIEMMLERKNKEKKRRAKVLYLPGVEADQLDAENLPQVQSGKGFSLSSYYSDFSSQIGQGAAINLALLILLPVAVISYAFVQTLEFGGFSAFVKDFRLGQRPLVWLLLFCLVHGFLELSYWKKLCLSFSASLAAQVNTSLIYLASFLWALYATDILPLSRAITLSAILAVHRIFLIFLQDKVNFKYLHLYSGMTAYVLALVFLLFL